MRHESGQCSLVGLSERIQWPTGFHWVTWSPCLQRCVNNVIFFFFMCAPSRVRSIMAKKSHFTMALFSIQTFLEHAISKSDQMFFGGGGFSVSKSLCGGNPSYQRLVLKWWLRNSHTPLCWDIILVPFAGWQSGGKSPLPPSKAMNTNVYIGWHPYTPGAISILLYGCRV